MFIVGLFSWWYGEGWKQRLLVARENLASTYDYFSIDLLARTLFSPFRQISAGKVRGSLEVQLRALFDQLLSRVIGATVRTIIIVMGTLTLMLTIILNLMAVLLWGVVPFVPLIAAVVASTGWIPWHL